MLLHGWDLGHVATASATVKALFVVCDGDGDKLFQNERPKSPDWFIPLNNESMIIGRSFHLVSLLTITMHVLYMVSFFPFPFCFLGY